MRLQLPEPISRRLEQDLRSCGKCPFVRFRSGRRRQRSPIPGPGVDKGHLDAFRRGRPMEILPEIVPLLVAARLRDTDDFPPFRGELRHLPQLAHAFGKSRLDKAVVTVADRVIVHADDIDVLVPGIVRQERVVRIALVADSAP